MTMNKTVKGFFWTATDKLSLQVINVVAFLVLARLLEPKSFGIFAISAAFVAFFQLFIDQGMAQAIIQFEEINNSYLDTAFWVSVVTGVVCAALGVLLSTPVALLFREPSLQLIIVWLSFVFVFSSLSSVQISILQRNLEFKKLALRSMVAKIFGGGVGVVLALMGAGVWSLVAQTLAYSIMEGAMLWSVSAWRPSFTFSFPYMSRLIKFGMNTMGVRLLDFLDYRFDDFVIGYLLGSVMLGYYTIAFRLLRLFLDIFGGIPVSVIFPILSRLQNNLLEFKNTYITAVKYINLLIWPVFLGAAALSEEIIVVFFGAQWISSIPVFRLLALGGVLMCSFQTNGSIAWAMGASGYMLRVRLIIAVTRMIVYVIAAQFGIIYVAFSYLLVNLFIFLPIYLKIPVKFIGMTIMENLNLYWQQAFSSVIMCVIVIVFKYFFALDFYSIYWRLILITGFGVLVYAMVIKLLWPRLFQQIRAIIADVQMQRDQIGM